MTELNTFEEQNKEENESENIIAMVIGWLMHGEFLQMSYIEYCDAFSNRQKRTMELQRFFETA